MKTFRLNRKLKICLIAPPWYPIPPIGYGGTERIVYLLYKGLTELGHKVTVIGHEDSDIDIIGFGKRKWLPDLQPSSNKWDRLFQYHNKIFEYLKHESFDIIHDHTKPPYYNIWSQIFQNTTIVHTLHDPINATRKSTLEQLKRKNIFYTGVSQNQLKDLAQEYVLGVVHNAVDFPDNFNPLAVKGNGGYLLQIGRIMEEKGQHIAVRIAKKLNMPLVLAGKVDTSKTAQLYFEKYIKPEIGKGIQHIESINGLDKWKLIAKADATINPLQWEEPFGLVLAESLVCGTPVLAFNRGAASEIIVNGKNGFLVANETELIKNYQFIHTLDKKEIHKAAVKKYFYQRMAKEYEDLYFQVIGGV